MTLAFSLCQMLMFLLVSLVFTCFLILISPIFVFLRSDLGDPLAKKQFSKGLLVNAWTTGPASASIPMSLSNGTQWINGMSFAEWHLTSFFSEPTTRCKPIINTHSLSSMRCFEEKARHYFWPSAFFSRAIACPDQEPCRVASPPIPDSQALTTKENFKDIHPFDSSPHLSHYSANCYHGLPEFLLFQGPAKKAFWVKSLQVQIVGNIKEYSGINQSTRINVIPQNYTFDVVSHSGCRDLVYGLVDVN
ncbi:hypothetical protein DSO57_1022245 [Entomophthora muscae]|uniref:Uncharacterized protein n=1 Tax=Entomophthora muscae TaxID=34485 RepID=A0ACC2UNR1_9FUNG|nr:hypothetical protein DSO57_1022245 [Entomophthora muscae]